ncbi:protein containing Peptidase S11, D-alanyl-D-alanine carboxypeptidase A domain [sediment metagenome]|uniref:Protein containing Peptidase S11, D-alanyl-D-alanine carboxypeptidase A domain n=1 Tax=sediment metagenome TaxID=749907 RepID=D9PKA1_9ZZZZ
MKRFLKYLWAKKEQRLNWILVLIVLSLIPGRNVFYDLELGEDRPLTRPKPVVYIPVSQSPVNITGVNAPWISARGAVVIDADDKTILYSKNPDLKLLPASTTKIMTALVALQAYPLDKVIIIDSVHQTGQVMKLQPGEKITVENLLYGLLVNSANDAATILAQNYPGGEDEFIKAMNQKSRDLGLVNTNFTNASGLDAYGHFTTAHDLALIAAEAMKQPVFKKIVGTLGITVADVDNTVAHSLVTINELLGKVPGLSGVKTGWTEAAGECFVAFVLRDNHQIITVVLGSADRFGETQQLINWVYSNFSWRVVAPASHR